MREFVMGARLQMTDMFSRPMSAIREATDRFRGSVERTNDATDTMAEGTRRLRDSLGRFTSSTREAEDQIYGATDATNSWRGALSGLGIALAAASAAAAFKQAYTWLIDSNAQMEQYKNTLTVVLKSQEKAVETLAWAEKFAAQTPFEIPQIVEATTRLSAYGLEAKKVLGITGDMASVMGKDLMQAVEAVADAQTGELERLKEFGITKDMITAQARLMKANPVNKQGQITDMKAFNAALFSLMEKRFKGGMEMQSKTFKGMLSNASDFMGTMGRQLGKPLFDKAKEGLSDMLVWMNRLKETGQLDAFIRNVQRTVGAIWEINESIRVGMIQAVKFVGDTFLKYLSPPLEWLGNKVAPIVLPAIEKGLNAIGAVAKATGKFFTDNWSYIRPLLEGLTLALGSYAAYVGVAKLATMSWTKVTALATAAQGRLTAIMAINPVWLWVAAIGALIGVGLMLYQNWDEIKAKALEVWKGMQPYIQAAKKKLQDFGQALIDFKDNAVQKVKDIIKDFTDTIEEHKTAITTTATILGVIFGPALIKTGVQATVAGAQIAASYIAQVVRSGIVSTATAATIYGSIVASMITTGYQAVINGAKITTSFVASLITASIQSTITGAKIMAGFVAAVIVSGVQGVITAGKITGQLIVALVAYAAQGWKTAIAIGAQTTALIANGVQAGISAAAQVGLRIAQVASTVATYAMTAAQWALNAAFWANPITWVVALIVGLIAIGVALWKNWDTIVAKAKVLWDGIKQVWNGLTSWVSGKISEAFTWGENIIKTMADGILAAKDWIVNKVKGVFDEVRKLMPFSDAKKGPFSELTYSGGAIITTMAQGVNKQAGTLHSAMADTFKAVPMLGGQEYAVNGQVNTPDVPTMATTLLVSTQFDNAKPPAYSVPAMARLESTDTPTYSIPASKSASINPAGTPAKGGNVTKTVTIQKLIEKIELNDVGNKDTGKLVEEIMHKLYDELQKADEILGNADMAVLL